MGRFTPGCLWPLLVAVALVLNGVEAMPGNVVSGAEFDANLAPFLAGNGLVPDVTIDAMHRALNVNKEGYDPDFDTGKKNDYLEFGDLGEDGAKPDPNRAEAPDKEMGDLEYRIRQTFIVQQHSVRRMSRLKRQLEALSNKVREKAGVVELGEEEDPDSMSSHELKHVLAWKPKPPETHQDSYPSMRDLEGHLDPVPTAAQTEARLGEAEEAKNRKDIEDLVAKGLKASLPKIRTQIYEEMESLKDLDGNAHELAAMTQKITQHVSATQQSQVNDLGAAYFIDHKVREGHHKTHAARVARTQLKKLAGVDKLNSLITSESKFAQAKLDNMLAVVKKCGATLQAKKQDTITYTGVVQNFGTLKKQLNGLLKRQAHVARQTLKKADGVEAYVNKLRKKVAAHELTPKEAGILP